MARRSDIPNVEINLIRILDVLQGLITPALCQAAFGRVRTTERQRKWSLEALVRFWTAVILRAPKALTQALVDSVEQRDVVFPKVDASPAAVARRCARSAPGLFSPRSFACSPGACSSWRPRAMPCPRRRFRRALLPSCLSTARVWMRSPVA